MKKEDERVTKSRKLSAGRFRERCAEMESMKAVKVWRHELGNESSKGSRGEYHHLRYIRTASRHCAEDILDIVTNDCIRQLRQRSGGLWLEVRVVERLARIQLHVEVGAGVSGVALLVRLVAPPVQHPLRYVDGQLPLPRVSALSLCLPAVAAMVPLPRRVQDNAAYNAYEDQPNAAEDEIGACA